MNTIALDQHIETTLQRLEDLRSQIISSPQDQRLLNESLDEFTINLKELGVAARELCQQSEEVFPNHQAVESEQQQYTESRQLNIDLTQQIANRTAELHESEAKYHQLVEQIPGSVYITGVDTFRSMLYVSPRILQMLGFTADEWVADPELWVKQFHPDDRQQVMAEVARCHATGEPFHLECRLCARDGHIVWAHLMAAIIRDDAGRPLFIQGVMLDITERKRLEAALQENTLQLEHEKHFITRILESIPSSLVVVDRGMHVISVNHNFLEKTRRELHTTLGRKIEEVFPPVLLEYTRLANRVQDVFHTGQPVEAGKVAYRAPGLPTRIYYYRLIPIYLAPRTSPGKSKEAEQVENVMVLMDDVTEREQLGEEVRRAERHLAGVVECANDLVVSMDSKGRIVTWNRAAEIISGLKAEQVKDRSLVSLCIPQQQPTMADLIRKLARGKSVQHFEVRLLTAGDQEIPIAWSCSPMHDDSDHVSGIVAVGRDLSEQRRLENQLIYTDKMASLGTMAGGIAHELRNPLGIISASAQLLMESPEDTDLRDQGLLKIHAATQRASSIIENLLKFARPEGGLVKKEVDLHSTLDETLALLDHQMVLQKVTLNRKYQPGLPHAQGSRMILQQVFMNLVLNACNAMPEGGTLTITTQTLATRHIEIHFSDTGRGIPSENLSKIFDPFFTTMPFGKGVGLGLSISHSIIQQHQGTIEVTSQVGKGSTFIVRLPEMLNPSEEAG
jgi:PAS domain S-box-containing protein